MDGEPINLATKMLAGRWYTLWGVSTICKSPPFNRAIRCPTVMAPDLVVGHVDEGLAVHLMDAHQLLSGLAPSCASRFESGSSSRKKSDRFTMARANATRWRWPPESSLG